MEKNYNLVKKYFVFFQILFIGALQLKSQVLTQTFSFSGATQTFVVPSCVTTITMEAWGAQGGIGTPTTANYGGYAKGSFNVTVGDVLSIYVGGQPTTTTGGYNGGGAGDGLGYGGGGGTDIRLNGQALSNRIIIAGGGGGGGYWNTSGESIIGGVGGGVVGGDGYRTNTTNPGGSGGGQTALVNGFCGSANNAASSGSLGLGGSIVSGACGCSSGYGGGGGYYGGGAGGNCRGGGGGSGYISTSATNTLFSSGITIGNGVIVLTYQTNGAGIIGNSSSSLICIGSTATLSASNVLTYTWTPVTSNATLITVSPTSNTSYTVQGTNSIGCISGAVFNLTVSPGLPALTITNSASSICLGKTATLTAGGAITYTWAGGPGGIINGQTFTPTATSNYTVTGQNGCGITTSVTTISIAPLAVNVSASPSLNCSGNPATLTAVSAVTGYTWSPGPITGSNVIVVPTVNTVYTVVASDGTCSGVAMVTVTSKPNPTLTIVASTQTVCQGAAVTLTASGALTYTWTSPVSNSPNISDNPTTVTLYQVSGTNSVNCTSSTSQLVFTQPGPTVAISASKIFVCVGDPVTLTASGANSYNWTNGPATAGNVVNPTANTTYTVSGTITPCSSSKTITINVLPANVLASVTTPSICNGASTSLHASGATSYTWVGQTAFSPGNVNVSPTITTIYTVSAITTSAGLSCPSSTNITVTVFDNPTVAIIATKSVVCKTDANIVLTGGGANTYTWSTSTVSANISVHPQATTTYTMAGTDANGCVNTASKVISVNACTGIAELNDKQNSISVYPNPSDGEFTIQASSEMILTLINELGQSMRIIALTESNNYKVSVNDLAKGIYFITGQKDNFQINQKVIMTK